jgi:hypothetical protein
MMRSFEKINSLMWAVPWLRRLVPGHLPRRLGFDPGLVHVGFVVALGQVFSPVIFIPPMLHYFEK